MTLGGRCRSGTTVGFGDIAADTTLDRVYITALMVAIPLAPLPAGTDKHYECMPKKRRRPLPTIDSLLIRMMDSIRLASTPMSFSLLPSAFRH